MREALAKFNDVRIQFFAEQADLHYVMANNDDDKKEINVVKTKLVALQSKVRAAKLNLRHTSRLEMEFRGKMRDALAQAEVSELVADKKAGNSVLESVRDAAKEAQLDAIESSSEKENADAADSMCRKAAALNALARNEFKDAGISLSEREHELEDAVNAFASLDADVSAEDRKMRKEAMEMAKRPVFHATEDLQRMNTRARSSNKQQARACGVAEYQRSLATAAEDDAEESTSNIERTESVAKDSKYTAEKASIEGAARDSVALTAETGAASDTKTGGEGESMKVPSMDKDKEENDAERAEAKEAAAARRAKASELAQSKMDQVRANLTRDQAAQSNADKAANAEAAMESKSLNREDDAFVNASVERKTEDADIRVTEHSVDAKVKDAEMGMEAAQDHLMRSLVDGSKGVMKAQSDLQKGPHNASIYTFDVPKSNCLTCGRHKSVVRDARLAAKASEKADAVGLTSRVVGQRLRVASIQAELNARRVQLKLNKDVAEHIRLLEKRVEKSASKAKLAIEEEEPSKNALVDAQSAESDAKIRANAARAAFEDAKGVYLVALKEEELQKSKLRAMEKKWKDDIDEKKKYAASAREAISTATTSEEEKKTLKSEARLELKKFANP